MTERQLLREFVSRFVKYDRARDKYVAFLEGLLDEVGMFGDKKTNSLMSRKYFYQKYGLVEKRERLWMDQDDKFCRCREIVRIVKKDPNAMWC